MTAIVGLVHQGVVHIGGDSAGVAGYDLSVRADAKVFRSGPYAFGFCGSFRMGQLLRYSLSPPTPERHTDLEEFMVNLFVEKVRRTLRDGGWLKKDGEREEGGLFLVGVRGRLFRIDEDFQVGETVDGFAAIGCGDQIALGALYATRRSRMAPRRRLQLALEAAERFSAGVRGPFAYVTTPEEA